MIFWIGEASSKFGSATTVVVMPLIAVTALSASPFQIGLLSAATWLPWLLIGLPAGAWVDRLPAWRVMLVSDVASALLLVSVPVAAWFGLLTLWQLLSVALLGGAASVFYSTAYGACVPALVPRDRLATANSRLQGTEYAAQVAGPGVGGVLVQVAGAVTGLLLDAVTFVVSALCLGVVRPGAARRVQTDDTPHDTGVFREIADGLRLVWTDGLLRTLTGYAAVANLAAGALQAVLVVFLARTVALAPGAIGTLLAVVGVGGIAGALAAAPLSKALGSARALLVCELGAMPFALLLPLTDKGYALAFLVVGGLVVSAGVVVPNVITATFVQTYCPHDTIGRVSASMRVVTYGTLPLGALMGGQLATVYGPRAAMWCITATAVLATVPLVLSPLRRIRDLPARSGPVLLG
ncbi:MFS transporter [Amycolatopsis sp. NPDC088138]|uniref:MFS transporter n=1 Tax=Amycolatopsis sp. NPDC088138 TaxID=3363938 RepID=UPI0038162F9E